MFHHWIKIIKFPPPRELSPDRANAVRTLTGRRTTPDNVRRNCWFFLNAGHYNAGQIIVRRKNLAKLIFMTPDIVRRKQQSFSYAGHSLEACDKKLSQTNSLSPSLTDFLLLPLLFVHPSPFCSDPLLVLPLFIYFAERGASTHGRFIVNERSARPAWRTLYRPRWKSSLLNFLSTRPP